MWGLRTKRNQTLSRFLFEKMIDRKINSIVNRFSNNTYFGDQKFLRFFMFPLIENDVLSHDSYACMKYRNVKPFPTRRLILEYKKK